MTDGTVRRGDAGPPRAGLRIAGRYLLEDRVSASPGASEWRATDELLARRVAVRVLSPGLAVTGTVFEAVRGTARLADYRLARVFDADHRCEYPYVVCEWPPGDRLDVLLAAGLPDPALAAAIVAKAAGALAVAHAAGQPHLCLTPQSVCWDGTTPKICSLGIEAALTGTSAADPAAADTAALAGLLYALLTGYWPGDDPGNLPPAPRRRGLPYAPRQLRAGVPASLDAITCRALSLGPHRAGPPISTPVDLAWALRPAPLRANPPPAPAVGWYRALPRRRGENTQPFHAQADGWDNAA